MTSASDLLAAALAIWPLDREQRSLVQEATARIDERQARGLRTLLLQAESAATTFANLRTAEARSEKRPSTLNEITDEKQRISEALVRVDAQRERLSSQLSELEAAERVLARYGKGAPARRTAAANTPTAATKATVPARTRARRTAKPAAGKRASASLGDQILALATGKTQQEIAAACKGARPNHVGVVIARHKRAGRIKERDGKLYATQSAGTGQRAVV
jgi:hypothetical protein